MKKNKRLSLKQKFIISILIIASVPLVIVAVLVDGRLAEWIDTTFVDDNMVPDYQVFEAASDQFVDSFRTMVKDESQAINRATIQSFDPTSKNKQVGFVVIKNEREIYRSPWLEDYQLDLFDDDTANYTNNLFFWSSVEFISLEDEFIIHSVYDGAQFNTLLGQVIGGVITGFVGLFALVSMGLFMWFFRHLTTSRDQLHDMTAQIISGNLQEASTYTQTDEFAELADMINTLRADLLQSSKDKDHLEKERERMLVNITHDIKTPITAIKGCAQMLSDGYVTDQTAQKEYLDIIVSRSHVIEDMVNNLKEVIKYDVGSIVMTTSPIPMVPFLEDCKDDFRIHNQDQDFTINLKNIPQDLTLVADPTMMQRVFKNIIGNALKYNQDQPLQVEIESHVIGNTIRFRIGDNGVGVPETTLDKLFDRMYRVDTSRTSKIEGSGIGLSICQEIINAHGGQIWAEQDQGQFNILFCIPLKGATT